MCACVCQVYNEQVRDLMCPGGPLALRVDAAGNAVVTGLTVHKVTPCVLILVKVLLLVMNSKY